MRKSFCVLLIGLLAPEAAAQDVGVVTLDIVEEVRVGIHAHAAHYSLWPVNVAEYDLSRIEDVSFDVLFNSPEIDAFRVIGSPLFELGTTINFAGRESTAHAALVWQLPVPDSPVFLEGAFGAAIHNGHLTGAPAGERNLGCRVNFYERFGVGVNLDQNLTALVSYEHTSNAGLCAANDGYSNFGLRVGRKF
jgi:hypothetical protein